MGLKNMFGILPGKHYGWNKGDHSFVSSMANPSCLNAPERPILHITRRAYHHIGVDTSRRCPHSQNLSAASAALKACSPNCFSKASHSGVPFACIRS